MTPHELRQRIVTWEDQHTDFKQSVGSNEDLAKDIVCFANSDGGQIIVGVSEDRLLMGVDDPDRLLLMVDDIAVNRCNPAISVLPRVVELDDKKIVVIDVPQGDQRPYSTSSGKQYVRSGSRYRLVSREELRRLFQGSGDLSHDEVALRGLDVTDLDMDELDRHLAAIDMDDAVDPMRLLANWRLLSDGHPTVAGVVLFGRRPQEALQSAGVVLAAVSGDDIGADLLDRKDVTGGLFEVIAQVEAFLALHLRTAHTIRGFEPEKHAEIPPAALREAVVNALVHRDYLINGPVRVFVLTDRVEVRSPGRPPNSIDADAMRAGAHVLRNPHLYARVAERALATRAGTGVRRIARLLRDNSGAELGIAVSDAEVVLTLPRRIPVSPDRAEIEGI